MADVIRLLPEALANQIAAGEVVQRPASAVKELLENAIDAKSQSIQLVIEEAGKQLIQVVDDGIGMSETDARLAFERHTTSKIKESKDLFQILTMGFRGEALASIAAVSQVELKTKKQESDIGVKIRIEASEVKEQIAEACVSGTSIAVKNLFFNVPARRNFLKSNPVEMRHILDVFQRVALAYPEKSFAFYNNAVEMYQLSEGKLSHRIVEIFGKNYRNRIAPCEEESPFLKVQGYIGKPESTKKTRGEQFFFVNKRFIKNNYLHHAVVNAFEGLLPENHHPFYVLFLEIDPKHIDVNVHPTKTEIKFDDERSIYAIVKTAVKKALNTHHFAPALDFDTNINFATSQRKPSAESFNTNYPQKKENKRNLVNWEKLYEGFEKKAVTEEYLRIPEEELKFIEKEENKIEETDNLTFESKINQMPAQETFEEIKSQKKVWQAHGKYLFAQVKSGFMLIDQKAAQQRIIYEKLLELAKKPKAASQRLLFRRKIQFNPSDFQIVLEIANEIRKLGFIFEENITDNTIILKGIPLNIFDEEDEDIFEGFLEQYKNSQDSLQTEQNLQIAKALTSRIVLKNSKTLTNEEINLLIDRLFASSNPQYTLDGKKIFVIISFEKIGKWLSGEEGI